MDFVKKCIKFVSARSLSSKTVFSKRSSKFRVNCVDSKGKRYSYEVSKPTLFHDELGLTFHDVRFQHTNMLAIRNKKIIVKFQKLKAIICSHAVMVIDLPLESEHSKSVSGDFEDFWRILPRQITGSSLYTSSRPLEYRALEAVFAQALNNLETTLSEFERSINELLDVLTDPANLVVDRSLHHVLLNHSAKLNTFATIVQGFCDTLDNILECDKDVRDLCISLDVEGENRFDARLINMKDEIEMLLDAFIRDAEDINNKVGELKEAIKNSNTAILIALDSHRNFLLRKELKLTIGRFSCTLFEMIGAAFGMNLDSALEDDRLVFWVATGIMVVGTGICWKYLLKSIKLPNQASSLLKETNILKLKIKSGKNSQEEQVGKHNNHPKTERTKKIPIQVISDPFKCQRKGSQSRKLHAKSSCRPQSASPYVTKKGEQSTWK